MQEDRAGGFIKETGIEAGNKNAILEEAKGRIRGAKDR